MIGDAELTFTDDSQDMLKQAQEGRRFAEIVKLFPKSVSLEDLQPEPEEKPETVGGRAPIWLGNRWWMPNDTWRTMRGMLSGHPEHDTSRVRHEERVWEAEHDERKFGPFSKG